MGLENRYKAFLEERKQLFDGVKNDFRIGNSMTTPQPKGWGFLT